MKLAALAAVMLLSACASGVPNLEVAQWDQTCTRWCVNNHPTCAFDGAIVEPKTEPLLSCHKKYLACVRSCPSR